MKGMLTIEGEQKKVLDEIIKAYIAEYILTKNAVITSLASSSVQRTISKSGQYVNVPVYQVHFSDTLDEIAELST